MAIPNETFTGIRKLEDRFAESVQKALDECKKKAEEEGWTSVIIFGYDRNRIINYKSSPIKCATMLVGALELAKFTVLDDRHTQD